MQTNLTHGALCNGIGGFALAARRAGIRTAWTCEIDPFCNAVSRRHFPDAHQYLNIYDVCHPPRVDVISAGYPCQPASYAGKRRGPADNRWLWPEVLRLLAQCRPRWFLGENVAGHLTLGLESVLADLEAEGYEVWPLVLPACAVDAPHRRDRVWIVAHAHHRQPVQPPQALCPGRDAPVAGGEAAPYSDSQRCGQPSCLLVPPAEGESPRPRGRDYEPAFNGPDHGMGWVFTQPPLCPGDDGLSRHLVRPDGSGDAAGAPTDSGYRQKDPRHWARNTLKAAGNRRTAQANALVPDIPQLFFQFIADYEAGRLTSTTEAGHP
ncbi:DNA cytosine methyltransferase [Hymenobacter sp.]|uniref:DNA cytosine methyltransferase n=1 Tax=Hymenobacter sp. TaxID=1898978 RepID=UPI0039C878ED